MSDSILRTLERAVHGGTLSARVPLLRARMLAGLLEAYTLDQLVEAVGWLPPVVREVAEPCPGREDTLPRSDCERGQVVPSAICLVGPFARVDHPRCKGTGKVRRRAEIPLALLFACRVGDRVDEHIDALPLDPRRYVDFPAKRALAAVWVYLREPTEERRVALLGLLDKLVPGLWGDFACCIDDQIGDYVPVYTKAPASFTAWLTAAALALGRPCTGPCRDGFEDPDLCGCKGTGRIPNPAAVKAEVLAVLREVLAGRVDELIGERS